MANVKAVGEHLRSGLEAIPGVTEVRGEGLLLGVGLAAPVAPVVVAAALKDGFILNAPNPQTLRLVPALTLEIAQAQTLVDWLSHYASEHPFQSAPMETKEY
jgi:acetylornithine/N-succinyldiaminopimelate aminotransferase